MKIVNKILVSVQIDNFSKVQLETAAAIAKKFNSNIILLCVLPLEAKSEKINKFLAPHVKAELNRMSEFLNYDENKIEQLVEYGDESDKIISISEMKNVNLIIHANRQNKDDSYSKVDNLSEKLIRKSLKPIMIVKSGTIIPPAKILCPVDYSESSERALFNAIKIARVFDSKLFIVNVFEPMQESFSTRLNIDFNKENNKLEAKNKEKYKSFIAKFNLAELDHEVISLTGNPDAVITEFAKSKSVDIIFIGSAGKSYVQRLLLGSTTENVLRLLPSSMIITKAENILELKIESDISTLEKHLDQAIQLEKLGSYEEAIEQLKICLHINDLHIPVLNRLSKLYLKLGENKLAKNYEEKANEILRRLWDKKIEHDIRRGLKI
ncbi:MAG: universal stress protein [Bacteroidetes bacterium]|nr:universal stress protein [Bacteroidota bacterium]